MKALTIIQPFAELIATGRKRVENRSWYTGHRGPLLIHAAKAKRYLGESVQELAQDYDLPPDSISFGAIVAVADLIGCVTLQPNLAQRNVYQRSFLVPQWAKQIHPWLEDHEHTEGPCCWILANVMRLPEPVVVGGALGLWSPSESVAEQVKRQLSRIDDEAKKWLTARHS